MRALCIVTSMAFLLCACVISQEHPLDATEQQALKVVNDSDWAHTITASVQEQNDSCEHIARDGSLDSTAAASAPLANPDDSQYLVRFQSAKPVQQAFGHLAGVGMSAYGRHERSIETSDDTIAVAVILKRVGSNGISFLDYAFADDGHSFPSKSFHVFRCTSLTTSSGQVHPREASAISDRPDLRDVAFELGFPRSVEGRQLISHEQEKVTFRMFADHEVFTTTFLINAEDVTDSSQRPLYMPAAFTDFATIAQ